MARSDEVIFGESSYPYLVGSCYAPIDVEEVVLSIV